MNKSIRMLRKTHESLNSLDSWTWIPIWTCFSPTKKITSVGLGSPSGLVRLTLVCHIPALQKKCRVLQKGRISLWLHRGFYQKNHWPLAIGAFTNRMFNQVKRWPLVPETLAIWPFGYFWFYFCFLRPKAAFNFDWAFGRSHLSGCHRHDAVQRLAPPHQDQHLGCCSFSSKAQMENQEKEQRKIPTNSETKTQVPSSDRNCIENLWF